MDRKVKILAIIDSASTNSSNLKLVEAIQHYSNEVDMTIYDKLSSLPHFDTAYTIENTPEKILEIRKKSKKAMVLLSLVLNIFLVFRVV